MRLAHPSGDSAATASAASSPGAADVLASVSVLVVDDEPGMRNFLTRILTPLCRHVEACADAFSASRALDTQHFDVVILDNVMPGMSGLDWLAEQRRLGFFAEAVLMTAYADFDTAIQALRVGAADLVLKPFRANQMLLALRQTLEGRYLRRENTLLKHELRTSGGGARGRLLGRSAGIEAVRAALGRAARVASPVLLTGETGTGKEIAARTLHALSEAAHRPFVAVNCAMLTEEVAMAELFGAVHAGGPNRDGLLQLASGGTLFLDEVIELPGTVQAMLLRVIEDGRIRPVGADREIPLSLRLVCASNGDPAAAVEAGKLRRDLYHRINVLTIHMPPLRERISDIADLAGLFMAALSRELGLAPLPLTEGVLVKLAAYPWPGNVRELRNLIERSLILGRFPPEFAGEGAAGAGALETGDDTLAALERRHILSILEASNGNRAEAARRLGVSRKTIDRKLAEWNG